MVDVVTRTPVASPVDAFIAPHAVADTNAALQLSQSLGIAADSAKSYFDARDKQLAEDARRKGLLYTALSEKDAIDKGIITEYQSPWFRKGQLEQQGRLAGDTYDAALNNAYNSAGMRTNTNPAAFTQFTENFRKQYLDKLDPSMSKDPDFLLGFGSKMTASEQQLQEQHVAQASDKMREDAVTGTQNEIYNEIMHRAQQGPFRPEDLIGPVSLVAARQKTFFLDGKEVSDAKIAAIGQAAKDLNRPDLLNLLETPSHDGTPGPALTMEGRKKVDAWRQSILEDQMRTEEYHKKLNDEYNKTQADQHMVSDMRIIAQGGTVPESNIQDGERFDPEYRLKIMQARKAIAADDDPAAKLQVSNAVNMGLIHGYDDIHNYLLTHDLQLSADTIEHETDRAKEIQLKVYSDPFVKGQQDIIGATLNPSGLGGLMGDSQGAAEAKARFAERIAAEVPTEAQGTQAWRDQVKKIKDEVLKEAQDQQNANVQVRGAQQAANSKTKYFPSMTAMNNAVVLYDSGKDKSQLQSILAKAGVSEDTASITAFYAGQKALLEQPAGK